MRVSHTNGSSIQGAETSKTRHTHGARKNERGEGAEASQLESTSSRGDVSASISPRARELANAKALATAAPDVREEKIAELKKRIAAGGYHVDADKIADRLVDDHIKMSGI